MNSARSTRSSTCSAPCAYLTCAPQHRTCWPPPRHNAGNRPKRCATAHRGARRPPSILNPGPAQSGRVPHRQDLRQLGRTVSSIPAPTQRALRTLEWIHRPRTSSCADHAQSKTHFLEALGQAAVDAGHKVSWFSLEHLGALVRRHSADDTAAKAIRRIMRADVIVIDDIGLLPVTTETAEALYRVVDAAYEKRSIALSSNLHPAGFDELMPKTIANATVDRLLHHAHVVMTAGEQHPPHPSHRRSRG